MLDSRKILITGGSGFIGTNLIQHFLEKGYRVANFDILSPRNSEHVDLWEKVDITDLSELDLAVSRFDPDYVVHLAARTDLLGRDVDAYGANIVGVQNLIDVLSRLEKVKRVIFASSRLVCRIGYQPKSEDDYCPTTPYGESKVIGEKIVRAAAGSMKYEWCLVRPTSIWGPWFEIPYKTFFMTVARGQYVNPKGHSILKSFGFVGNTVYELDRILFADSALFLNKRSFYLADYPAIEVSDMADSIQEHLSAPKVRSVPVGILRVAAILGDFLKVVGWKNPPLTSFRLNNLLQPMTYDLTPLQSMVGALPFTMKEGVGITAKWLKKNGEV